MIEIYHAERCPYCVKVRAFLEESGVSYISHPVSLRSDSPIKEKLKSIGGKVQVPFLVDPSKDTKMYESDDIIEYVRGNYLN